MKPTSVDLSAEALRPWAERYLADFAYEHTRSTARTYSSWMNRFFIWMEEEKGVEEPTLADFSASNLDEYVRYQRSRAPEHRSVCHDPANPPKVVNRNTVRSALHPIKGLAKYLIFKKQLTENPLDTVSLPSKDTKGTRPIGTDDEIYRVIQEAEKVTDPKTRALDLAILYMVANSAARVTEICNMPLSALNLKEGRITVVAKGGKEQIYYFTPRTGDAVAAWLAFRPKDCRLDRLFCYSPGRAISDEYIRKIICQYASAAGIEDHRGVLPHAQKHRIGCRLIDNGVDIVTVAHRLAHSRPTTTLQHYLHANDARIRASRAIGLETVIEASQPQPQPELAAQPAAVPAAPTPVLRPRQRQREVPKAQLSKSAVRQLLAQLASKPQESAAQRNRRGK